MAQAPSSGSRGRGDHPLTDRHLAALLGGADADLLAAISILALSGMRFDKLRRLRMAQCGRGAFRVGECRANDGPREVSAHSALVRTTIRLTRCVVPGSSGASLTREGEDALWRQVFTAQPERRRVFEPSSKRRKRAPGPWPTATA